MKRRNVILISLACLLLLVVPFILSGSARRRAESINCGNQMVAIGCAVHLWADENEGRLPYNFTSMSNELSTPKILFCPGDHVRLRATNWSTFTPANCSYEIMTTNLTDHDYDKIISRCKVHGYLGYGDGTVFDGQRRRAKVFW